MATASELRSGSTRLSSRAEEYKKVLQADQSAVQCGLGLGYAARLFIATFSKLYTDHASILSI